MTTARARSSRVRLISLVTVSVAVASLGALAILLVGVATLFLARRLYARLATLLARILLRVWSIRLEILSDHGWPDGQVVYISNHPSTLDIFVLVALGLPNTRFFLSGYLKKYLPIGVIAWLMGTFFTVTQDKPAQRVRIFQRADRVLRRTRESVYLSPEGQRVPSGGIGAFNKGAFHLATSLRVPIVPLYFDVPDAVTPGAGIDSRPGTVRVHVLPPIDTTDWRVPDVSRNRDDIHRLFTTWNVTLRRPA
jgi:1-acyl-sn-glycerol-3-phosphate acyltransferase